MAVDEDEDFFGIGDRADADGQSLCRDCFRIVPEETGVDDAGVGGEVADTGAGREGGVRLVEGDVPVNADTTHEEVDAAVGGDLLFVAGALAFGVVGHTVEDVDVLRLHVDEMVEEVVMHEVPVALVMLMGQAEVLVHVEGDDVREGDFTGFVHADEFLVDADRRRTGRKAQDEGSVLFMVVDLVSDIMCGPKAHFLVIVLDNYSHS